MSAPMTCRLFIDPPADGAWNMAVDEALLESAALTNVLTLRFYRWSQPTLSLGYFQRYEDRRLHPASMECPCVRRSSGGGAILHDQELTYSLAVPPSHALARRPQQLYELMHATLIEALLEQGVTPVALVARPASVANEPFLCFQRRATGDVLWGPHKIAGSAQRRWRGAVLQHGSILLSASPIAPELPGPGQARQILAENLTAGWLRLLPRALGISISAAELSPEEVRQAHAICAARYLADDWTARR
jgi:lipoate-protein ligase A